MLHCILVSFSLTNRFQYNLPPVFMNKDLLFTAVFINYVLFIAVSPIAFKIYEIEMFQQRLHDLKILKHSDSHYTNKSKTPI